MLIFYTILSIIIFGILGLAFILEGNSKKQIATGSIFTGISMLGTFCLIIEYMLFRGI